MSLYHQIQTNLTELSPAMKKIADYFLSHFDDLPFESAESIAEYVGVSSISVGRYLRQLGFQNMDDLRAALKLHIRSRWQTDRLEAHIHRQTLVDGDDDSLNRDIQHLQKIHALRNSDTYQNMLQRLMNADAIHIIGLQSCRGLMLYFYSLLEYMRPNVYYSDGNSGAFVDVFNQNHPHAYMLFADIRVYAAHSQSLCLAAQGNQLNYGFITDVYCPWATQLQGDILQVETNTHQFWDSTMPILALLQHLLNDFAHHSGNTLQARIHKNKQLQDYFKQFEA